MSPFLCRAASRPEARLKAEFLRRAMDPRMVSERRFTVSTAPHSFQLGGSMWLIYAVKPITRSRDGSRLEKV